VIVVRHRKGSIKYHPIGVIHSPYKSSVGTPIQPVVATDSTAIIEVFAEYSDGLKDVEGFSHLMLFFHMHLAKKAQMKVIPFLDTCEHGIFATRSPSRPNPIGFSVVKLLRVEGRLLSVTEVDILDGTPLLDIKPFVPEFDDREEVRTGWFESKVKNISEITDDGRFCKSSE
jgi:tRNA (adenine37-N6)-methyltransferase